MLLFYLITFLYGSNSLPVSLLEKVEIPQSGDLLAEIKSKVNKTKHNDLLTEIKSNPQQFISEVQNLDPASLKPIIALLEDVLEKSEEREQTLVDDLANKDSALSDANDDVIDAGDTLDEGKNAVELQKIVVAEAERVLSNEKGVLGAKEHDVAVAESDLDDKKEVHKAKKAERETSKEAHDEEVPDLNDEQQILRDVIDIIQGLHDKQGPDTQNYKVNGCRGIMFGAVNGVTGEDATAYHIYDDSRGELFIFAAIDQPFFKLVAFRADDGSYVKGRYTRPRPDYGLSYDQVTPAMVADVWATGTHDTCRYEIPSGYCMKEITGCPRSFNGQRKL